MKPNRLTDRPAKQTQITPMTEFCLDSLVDLLLGSKDALKPLGETQCDSISGFSDLLSCSILSEAVKQVNELSLDNLIPNQHQLEFANSIPHKAESEILGPKIVLPPNTNASLLISDETLSNGKFPDAIRILQLLSTRQARLELVLDPQDSKQQDQTRAKPENRNSAETDASNSTSQVNFTSSALKVHVFLYLNSKISTVTSNQVELGVEQKSPLDLAVGLKLVIPSSATSDVSNGSSPTHGKTPAQHELSDSESTGTRESEKEGLRKLLSDLRSERLKIEYQLERLNSTLVASGWPDQTTNPGHVLYGTIRRPPMASSSGSCPRGSSHSRFVFSSPLSSSIQRMKRMDTLKRRKMNRSQQNSMDSAVPTSSETTPKAIEEESEDVAQVDLNKADERLQRANIDSQSKRLSFSKETAPNLKPQGNGSTAQANPRSGLLGFVGSDQKINWKKLGLFSRIHSPFGSQASRPLKVPKSIKTQTGATNDLTSRLGHCSCFKSSHSNQSFLSNQVDGRKANC